VTWGSLYLAISGALGQIGVAGFTLLPALLAGWIYETVLSRSPTRSRLRIALDFGVAVIVAGVIAYVGGAMCPQDETGMCLDDDWKASTTNQRFESFMRISILAFSGMIWALHHRAHGPS
jgi:hypothetical protein